MVHLRIVHNKLTQLENLRELATHAVFQVFRLRLGHLATREVKNFLAKNNKYEK